MSIKLFNENVSFAGLINFPEIQDVQAFILNLSGGTSGIVQSFNSRTGIVVLTNTDIINALGYIPSSLSDLSGTNGIDYNNTTGILSVDLDYLNSNLNYIPLAGNEANPVTGDLYFNTDISINWGTNGISSVNADDSQMSFNGINFNFDAYDPDTNSYSEVSIDADDGITFNTGTNSGSGILELNSGGLNIFTTGSGNIFTEGFFELSNSAGNIVINSASNLTNIANGTLTIQGNSTGNISTDGQLSISTATGDTVINSGGNLTTTGNQFTFDTNNGEGHFALSDSNLNITTNNSGSGNISINGNLTIATNENITINAPSLLTITTGELTVNTGTGDFNLTANDLIVNLTNQFNLNVGNQFNVDANAINFDSNTTVGLGSQTDMSISSNATISMVAATTIAINSAYATLVLDNNINTFTDNNTNQAGLQYAADYSSNYTDRSLIDYGTVLNLISASTSGGAVTSFNTRVGAIILTSSDVTTALTYTPIQLSSLTSTSPISYSTSGNISITKASASTSGYLSNSDWNTFDNKQNSITLTTTGSSGSSTFISNTLNIPVYTLAGLGGITLSSISVTTPLSYNNSTGVISITKASASTSGYLSNTDWNTFNNKQSAITLSTTGSNGASTFISNTLNIPVYTLTGLGGFTNPMTTIGDIIFGGTSGTATRLGIGSSNNLLGVSSGNPVWGSPSTWGLPTLSASNTFTGTNMFSVNGPAASVANIENTSSTGYTSIGFMDNTGTPQGGFGYGNSGVAAPLTLATYVNAINTGGIVLNSINSSSAIKSIINGSTAISATNTSVSIPLTTASTTSSTGALTVAGGAGIAGQLSITGGLFLNGDQSISGTFNSTARNVFTSSNSTNTLSIGASTINTTFSTGSGVFACFTSLSFRNTSAANTTTFFANGHWAINGTTDNSFYLEVNGNSRFTSNSASLVPIMIRGFGAASVYTQTADLQDWQSFNGTSSTTLASVNNLGKFTFTAATVATASINIPSGVASTSGQVSGDIYFDSTNIQVYNNSAYSTVAYVANNGATKLATITGINAKTVATTVLYTVPTGKTAVITHAIIKCTAASAITSGPTCNIFTVSTGDIFTSTTLSALTTTTSMFAYTTVGMSTLATTGNTITFSITSGASGTSQTIAIDLIGYIY